MLYLKNGQSLTFSPIVTSPDSNQVQLYSFDESIRVLEDEPRYLGDYHAHPVGSSWLSQLPSPENVTSISALADFWPNDIEPVKRAPTFQLVQADQRDAAFVPTLSGD